MRTELLGPPEQAFNLSLAVEAHTGSMSNSGERAVRGVTRGQLRLGEEVTWRARHFGLVWTMTSKITEWDRPCRFVDEQVDGPFATFRHEHVFTPVAGGTSMLDRVTFSAPFGLLGRAAERMLLERYLRRLIQARNAYLKARLIRAD
jgi:ligand-binding SRPBCC domain-containing protein